MTALGNYSNLNKLGMQYLTRSILINVCVCSIELNND